MGTLRFLFFTLLVYTLWGAPTLFSQEQELDFSENSLDIDIPLNFGELEKEFEEKSLSEEGSLLDFSPWEKKEEELDFSFFSSPIEDIKKETILDFSDIGKIAKEKSPSLPEVPKISRVPEEKVIPSNIEKQTSPEKNPSSQDIPSLSIPSSFLNTLTSWEILEEIHWQEKQTCFRLRKDLRKMQKEWKNLPFAQISSEQLVQAEKLLFSLKEKLRQGLGRKQEILPRQESLSSIKKVKKDWEPFEEQNSVFLIASSQSRKVISVEEKRQIHRRGEELLQQSQRFAHYFLKRNEILTQHIEKKRAPLKQVKEESKSRISNKDVPLQIALVPPRPEPLLELGSSFLGAGPLGFELTLPTGTIWQPSLLVFGNFRTALQYSKVDRQDQAEWVNRLDIFANLQLNGFANERLLIGFRPLDDQGEFSGYSFEPEAEFVEGSNPDITLLFFEGDFGEIFPFLNGEDDSSPFDIGFSVGRQPLNFQSGILINDIVDAVGITKNNILLEGTSNLRLTFLYAWNDLNRSNFQEDNSASLFALLSSFDWVPTGSTVDLDLVYTIAPADTGDAFHFGLSATQRLLGDINSTFRINISLATEEETQANNNGVLLLVELSYSPGGEIISPNLIYLNAFWAIDNYSSALRDPASGGPLAAVGILYAGTGIGSFPTALDSTAERCVGFSLGYQHSWDLGRKQIILEVGGRENTGGDPCAESFNTGQFAIGSRYQQAFGQYFIMRLDSFIGFTEDERASLGGRMELNVKF